MFVQPFLEERFGDHVVTADIAHFLYLRSSMA